MAALVVEKLATAYPVTLAQAKVFLRVSITDDDDFISNILIPSATEACENFTNRSFCYKGYRQSLDSFPSYTDRAMSQQACPPSYYALSRSSTTLWNYSQMIKLFRPPLASVDSITFLASADSQFHDLKPAPFLWYPSTTYQVGDQVMDNQNSVQKVTTAGTTANDPPVWNKNLNGSTSDNGSLVWKNMGPLPASSVLGISSSFGYFLQDRDSEPARIFPPPGLSWPPVLDVPNAVQIHFVAGFSADGSLVPSVFKTAILQCCANWYENREAAMLGNFKELPNHVQMLLWTKRVLDMQPTRG